MKITLKNSGTAMLLAFVFTGCAKQEIVNPDSDSLSAAEVQLIKSAGLHADGAKKLAEGYLIEGDLLLTAQQLDELKNNNGPNLLVANAEQYRTTNLVTGLPRTLRVNYTGTTASISTAVNNAIARYNALPLLVKFTRVTTAPYDITISNVNSASYIASAGFPSNGNPFNSIKFNRQYANWNANTLTSIISHEIGHCIGFRHTDYMDRSYSCGGSFFNEGASTVGAILIPGTPSGPDPNSWMLACIGNGINRPFNANDRIALDFLY
jgi:hypothetical protein